jgi:hypothetical protein
VPNGDIFVADGHTGGGTVGNARVVKFDEHAPSSSRRGKKGMNRASSTRLTRWRSIPGRLSSRPPEQPHPVDQDGSQQAQLAPERHRHRQTHGYALRRHSNRVTQNQHRQERPAGHGLFVQSRTRRGIRIGARRSVRFIQIPALPVCGRHQHGGRRGRRCRRQCLRRRQPHGREEVRAEEISTSTQRHGDTE